MPVFFGPEPTNQTRSITCPVGHKTDLCDECFAMNRSLNDGNSYARKPVETSTSVAKLSLAKNTTSASAIVTGSRS